MNHSKQIEQQLLIDRVCDAFERDLKAAASAKLSDFIPAEAEASTQDALFEQLLILELEYRTTAGEPLEKDDYLRRYPQRKKVVERVFSGESEWTQYSKSGEDTRGESAIEHPGDLVGERIGPYALLSVAGYGGMGVVYLAEHQQTGRRAALKLLRSWDDSGPDQGRERLDRFLTEIRVASSLDHPNIVPVYEVGEHQARPFFAMRMVAGADLSSCVAERSLDDRAVATTMAEISDAVQFAHAKGVLHRDIKPGNILLSEEGKAYLTDFGIAKVQREDNELTTEQSFLGSLAYMSPEQTCDSAAVDEASDIYSLGATLYFLLSGSPPFDASQDAFVTIRQINEVDPPPLRLANKKVNPWLEAICLKCLAKSKADRYTTAGDLRDDLQRYLKGEPVRAKRVTRWRRARMWIARNQLATGAGLMAILLAIVAASAPFVFSELWQGRQAEKRQQLEQFVDNGDWSGALEYIQSTDGDQSGNRTVSVELARFRSLEAVGRTREAHAVVETLSRRSDLESYQATVLALDSCRLQMIGERQNAIAKAKQVLELEPEGVAADFARALLAAKPTIAIRSLQNAAKDWSNPLHHSASQLLISSYILAGRREDAERHCLLVKTLYPQSPASYIAEAWIDAIEGDLLAAEATLRDCPSKMSEAEIVEALRVLRFWSKLNAMSKEWRNGDALLRFLSGLIPDLKAALLEADSPTARFLPCFEDTYSKVAMAVMQWKVPFVGPSAAMHSMQQVVEAHPEGSLFFVLGTMQFISARHLEGDDKIERWKQAATSFENALANPGALPEVEWQSRLMSAICHNVVYLNRGDEALRQVTVQRYAEYRLQKDRFPDDIFHVLVSGIPALNDQQLLGALVEDAFFHDTANGDAAHADELLHKAELFVQKNRKEHARKILRQMINVDGDHQQARKALDALQDDSK